MPTLTLMFKNEAMALFDLKQGRSLTIGRRNDNDIMINNLAVSGYHGKIDSVGDGFVYIDLQSKNGSFVNEKLINSHWLEDGDMVSIGKHSLVFAYNPEELHPDDQDAKMEKTMAMDTNHYRAMMKKSKSNPDPPSAPSSAPPPAPPPQKLSKRIRGFLSYLTGGEGHIRLRSKLTKIGRDAASDIVVKGFTIGKTAVTISRTDEGYVLNYVGGMTKPRVNDQKVTKKAVILKGSDIIDIGSTKLKFVLRKVKIKPH